MHIAELKQCIQAHLENDATIYPLARLLFMSLSTELITPSSEQKNCQKIYEIFNHAAQRHPHEQGMTSHFVKKQFNRNQSETLSLPCAQSMTTFQQYVKLLLSNLTEPLLSTQQAKNIENLSTKIPALFKNGKTFLEFRLNQDEQVDLSISIPPNQQSFKLTSECKPLWDLTAQLIKHCYIEDENNILVYPEGFEFDVRDTQQYPTPNICLTFHPSLSQHANLVYFAALLKNQLNLNIQDETINRICECLSHLPSENYLRHIGYMHAREESGYKLIIYSVSPEKILNYLRNINWQGNYSLMENFLQKIPARFFLFTLSLDILRGSVVRASIEIAPSIQNENGFGVIFDVLKNYHAIEQGKIPALLDAEFFYWDGNLNFYLSHIQNIKITFHSEEISAKAYLRFFSSSAFA